MKELSHLSQLEGIRTSLMGLESADLSRQIQDVQETMSRLDNVAKSSEIDELHTAVNKLAIAETSSSTASTEKWGEISQSLGKLDELKALSKLGNLDELSQLQKLNQLDSLESLSSIEGSVAQLSQLHRLSKLDVLDKLSENGLENVKLLPDMSAKIKNLERITTDTNFTELQGEVRAVLDHLLGVHSTTADSLRDAQIELQQFKDKHASLAELDQEILRRKSTITDLEDREKQLLTHNAGLKAELHANLEHLTMAEERFAKLGRQLRENDKETKTVLGKHEVHSNNKENEIVMPKRQLRSISVQQPAV